jgi:hypothetical protein
MFYKGFYRKLDFPPTGVIYGEGDDEIEDVI